MPFEPLPFPPTFIAPAAVVVLVADLIDLGVLGFLFILPGGRPRRGFPCSGIGVGAAITDVAVAAVVAAAAEPVEAEAELAVGWEAAEEEEDVDETEATEEDEDMGWEGGGRGGGAGQKWRGACSSGGGTPKQGGGMVE